jgi:serine/threonine-protein kinase
MYPQPFGKYVLERELARGGMARVVLATLRGAGGFEKKLVVKQIRDELAFDDEWVRRFVEEAKTTVALSHPNIVPVYELGVELGTYFLAMELVLGCTLAELLKHTGALSPEEGAYVGVEVCRALEYAHRRMRVVHRDLTPRNVMIDEEGQVKVIDFGIATPQKSDAPEAHEPIEVFGSPGHMPLEQIEGKPLSPATDIFAVAVALMEAWSLKAPFRKKNLADSIYAMKEPHPTPSGIDPRLAPLDDVIGRAMRVDAAARPQDAEELGRALRKFLTGVDVGDLARGLGERVRAVRAKQEAARPAPPKPAVDEAKTPPARLERPKTPSIVDLHTKTFAARKELTVWTSPRGFAPVGAIEPTTRKMAPSDPPPPDGADRAETIATRPIETGAGSARPQAQRRFVGGIAIGMIAAAGALIALRKPAVPVPTVPVASATVTASAPATASATATATAPASASASATATASASPSPSASTSAPARLSLLADPGTRVTIDGAARGAVPLRDLPLEPGPHDVRFTFDPTGESRGERVTVRSGERVTVRADFSAATPTVRVER